MSPGPWELPPWGSVATCSRLAGHPQGIMGAGCSVVAGGLQLSVRKTLQLFGGACELVKCTPVAQRAEEGSTAQAQKSQR